jgi:hypothetical protein
VTPEHALKVSRTLALLYPALTGTGPYIHLLYLRQILYILAEQDDKQLNRIRGVKFNGFAAGVCGRKPCANIILLLFAFPEEHTSAVLHTSATIQSLYTVSTVFAKMLQGLPVKVPVKEEGRVQERHP